MNASVLCPLTLVATLVAVCPLSSVAMEYCMSKEVKDGCHSLNYFAKNSWMLSNQLEVVLKVSIGEHELHTDLEITSTTRLSVIGQSSRPSDTKILSANNIVLLNISVIEIENIQISGKAEAVYNENIPTTSLQVVAGSVSLHRVWLVTFNAEIAVNYFEVSNCYILYCNKFRMCGSKLFSTDEVSAFVYDTSVEQSQITLLYNDTLCAKKVYFSLVVDLSLLTGYKVLIDSPYLSRVDGKPDYLVEYPIHFNVDDTMDLNLAVKNSWCNGMLVDLEANSSNVSVTVQNVYLHVDENGVVYDSWLLVIRVGEYVQNSVIDVKVVDSNFTKAIVAIHLTYYALFSNHIDFSIANCHIFDNVDGIATTWVNRNRFATRSCEEQSVINVHILNTVLVDNNRGISVDNYKYSRLTFSLSVTESQFIKHFKAIDVTRTDNQLFVPYNALSSSPLIRIYLIDSVFDNNLNSSIKIVYTDVFVIDNCTIQNNEGTAVDAYFSDVTLSGNTWFLNNTGERGGAMSLYQSFLILGNATSIVFQDNSANDVGGAIYVYEKQLTETDDRPCFFQLSAKNTINLSFLTDIRFTRVDFINNTARKGGDNVFGGKFSSQCMLFLYNQYINVIDRHFIQNTFFFDNQLKATLSSVSSDPTRVCLCDCEGVPRCGDREYIFKQLPSRYPGETFSLSAVVVGYEFGTVPGIVYATLNGGHNGSLSNEQYVQGITSHQKCSLLYYTVLSSQVGNDHHLQLDLGQNPKPGDIDVALLEYNESHQIINDILLYQPIELTLLIEKCPAGFVLTTDPPFFCTCHSKLVENGIDVCAITNHTGLIYRSGTLWASSTFEKNETSSFVVHRFCPYDYCKPENVSVNLLDPDKQCAFSHSGVLCGGCQGDLSIVLGSSQCLPCDSTSILLILPFIVAGFALVLFIKVLDFTVTQGTLNGLIFYANILWANRSIFFPPSETFQPFQHFLHAFIAWLNLDLGVETCFFKGLNGYWKTWLQFLFPLYVWSITGVIIISAHYSTRASRLFGNNSVPVLATLILLSYTKLLRTVITCFGFSVLDYPQGQRLVWSFDGNVPYFGAAHSILFLAALAVLLFLWLPYTLVLLTLQWLRRKSNMRGLRWINRWKPLFDAYFGQLKPKHQYWVGLLLLVRVFLLVLFATTSAVIPGVNILAVVIVGIGLFFYLTIAGVVYKSLALSVLELSFIANLTVLAAVNLYITNDITVDHAALYTSISIVFIQFWALVFYHAFVKIKTTFKTYKRRHRVAENIAVEGDHSLVPRVVHDVHYREPLLDTATK